MQESTYRYLKELRRKEVRKDITILKREINKNRFTREDNKRFLKIAQDELKELNEFLK